MSFTEPLSMQEWFIQIFAGNPDIFLAIALITITAMAGYFRISNPILFFLLGMFLLMFASFVSSPIIVFIAVVGGLVLGLTLSKIFSS
jgi:hypothetical protein